MLAFERNFFWNWTHVPITEVNRSYKAKTIHQHIATSALLGTITDRFYMKKTAETQVDFG